PDSGPWEVPRPRRRFVERTGGDQALAPALAIRAAADHRVPGLDPLAASDACTQADRKPVVEDGLSGRGVAAPRESRTLGALGQFLELDKRRDVASITSPRVECRPGLPGAPWHEPPH